ncbi:MULTISPECIES: hypothetical protein [Cyanophyceae]|uniref:hypothetical protein n=1 Tax=Cyanophyceae TaxID=3028117 RepID=UPI00168517ED|nr:MULTISPECIES: hypothetical protein [Cyanophyceae]MBD1914694.1 hypothetical protein [Phormidium sp. FACHB-77]MBD2032582.1 hypothetical protein [Phormidium sp. FACHB-322]MBD2049440.1 hypothetical protein [Leptolyngbya sp. FACHB-60]
MSTGSDADEVQVEPQDSLLSEFFEDSPPNQVARVSDLAVIQPSYTPILNTPEIQLHCASEVCDGIRFFRCVSTDKRYTAAHYKFFFLTYQCSNCRQTEKHYSLAVKMDHIEQPTGEIYKFGESPPFGPPTPSRLIKLIGPDRDIFLKGRRCENQGLGIGAFVYYRRVVENQKNRILKEIIKVSEKISLPLDKIQILRDAVQETQFSRALDMTRNAVPESLLINGHSPLLLLHSALSEGVHALSDEDCLELASSIRVVLGELSERLAQALKDEAELSRALTTLMHHKKANSSNPPKSS